MVANRSGAAELAFLAQTGDWTTLVSVGTNSLSSHFAENWLWLFGNAFVVNEADSFLVATVRAELTFAKHCAVRIVSDTASTKVYILSGYVTVRPSGQGRAYRFPAGSMVEVKDRGWRQPITARRLTQAERTELKSEVSELLN
jgi:hypothetical protein